MTSQQMYQLFQVLYDQIDSQAYPEIYPEQVFDFLNLEVDRWCTEARKAFETSTELTDYMQSLVVDCYANNSEPIPSTEAIFKLTDLRHSETGANVPYRYLIAMKTMAVKVGDKKANIQVKEQTHNHRSATLSNPFTKPSYSLCPFVVNENQVIVDIPKDMEASRLRMTVIRKPATISKTQDSDIAEGLHRLLVEKAVVRAKQGLQPVQQ